MGNHQARRHLPRPLPTGTGTGQKAEANPGAVGVGQDGAARRAVGLIAQGQHAHGLARDYQEHPVGLGAPSEPTGWGPR